jgi:hypothetical protein
MRRSQRIGGCVGVLALFVTTVVSADGRDTKAREQPPRRSKPTAKDSDGLAMSTAVVCRTIDGYEDYEPQPNAALTSDQKLLIYYRPRNFQLDRQGKFYKAHLVQDGRIRRKGQKAVLFSRDKMVDFETKYERPFQSLYVKSQASLKGLKPGEYEFEIILHDEVAKSAPVSQTVSFKVVSPSKGGSSDEAPPTDKPADEAERPSSPR